MLWPLIVCYSSNSGAGPYQHHTVLCSSEGLLNGTAVVDRERAKGGFSLINAVAFHYSGSFNHRLHIN